MISVSSFARWISCTACKPLLCGLIVASLTPVVVGQTGKAKAPPAAVYREDHPRDVTLAEQTTARTMLRKGAVTDPKLFDTVYQWRCSQLTWLKKLNDTADLRVRLKADLRAAERADKPDTFERLTPLVMKAMLAITQNRGFHPASRLNAMLLLGDLNARVSAGGTTRFVPHPEVLPHLLSAVQLSAMTVSGTDDAIRAAALQGLVRHGKAAEETSLARQEILKAAIAIASDGAVPQGRSDAVHEWIRRRAVTVLESTLKPQASSLDREASDLLRAMIADRGLALKLRLDGAKAYGCTHKDRPADALADSQLARALGALTIDLLSSEVVGGRYGPMLRSSGSRDALAQGWNTISLALQTVEAAQPKGKLAAADKQNPKDPVAVQYLRSQLVAIRQTIQELADPLAARSSIQLARDLNAWLDREPVVQATDPTPEAMKDRP